MGANSMVKYQRTKERPKPESEVLQAETKAGPIGKETLIGIKVQKGKDLQETANFDSPLHMFIHKNFCSS